jgi:hypothetical protein
VKSVRSVTGPLVAYRDGIFANNSRVYYRGGVPNTRGAESGREDDNIHGVGTKSIRIDVFRSKIV